MGDEARKWGPPFLNNTSETCYFASVNRNKKSVCVNMKNKEGKEILYKLAEKCDVLVENFIPGKLDEMHLGYNDFKSRAPHLIYCSITGYGFEGPYKNKPGYDVIAASMGGLLHITGPKNGDPVKVGVAVTDLATGLYAHGAIMAALLKRMKTGRGQKIDCNLLSTQVASLINIGSNYLNAGQEGNRWGTSHESIVPYQAFKTLDGYYTLGTGSNSHFKHLCELLEIPDLAENEKFLTNKDRVENREELIEILSKIFYNKTNDDCSKLFEKATFPNGPVNSLEKVFNDPHVKEINLIQEIEHRKIGKIKVVGPPVKYSDGCTDIKLPPPLLGEHTDDILKNLLNYDENLVLRLKKERIIQ